MSSVDKLCKQYGPRSIQAKRHAWSGSKAVWRCDGILEIFSNDNFEEQEVPRLLTWEWLYKGIEKHSSSQSPAMNLKEQQFH